MKSLLLDTSAVYALVNARDKNHARAGQFLADWLGDSGAVLVTDSVFIDKEWSFVDCGLWVVAQRLGVPIFAFDHHFEQMPEVERVP